MLSSYWLNFNSALRLVKFHIFCFLDSLNQLFQTENSLLWKKNANIHFRAEKITI